MVYECVQGLYDTGAQWPRTESSGGNVSARTTADFNLLIHTINLASQYSAALWSAQSPLSRTSCARPSRLLLDLSYDVHCRLHPLHSASSSLVNSASVFVCSSAPSSSARPLLRRCITPTISTQHLCYADQAFCSPSHVLYSCCHCPYILQYITQPLVVALCGSSQSHYSLRLKQGTVKEQGIRNTTDDHHRARV